MTPAPVLQLVPLDAPRPEPEALLLLRPFWALRAFAAPKPAAAIDWERQEKRRARRACHAPKPWKDPRRTAPHKLEGAGDLLGWVAPVRARRPAPVRAAGLRVVESSPRVGRPGSKSAVLPMKPLSGEERAQLEIEEAGLRALGILGARPANRGECMDEDGPCPWVSCRHHLYLDVNPETGAITVNFPHLEPDEMIETCSLRAIQDGPLTQEAVGRLLNVTDGRITQFEQLSYDSFAAAARPYLGSVPDLGKLTE